MLAMATDETLKSGKLWRAIIWSLRITVALQCLGNWQWLIQIGESPLLSWLIDPRDIGGLAWSEATGLAVQQTVGWLVIAAGGVVLLRPYAAVLVPLSLFQLLIAVATWRTNSGFTLHAEWLSPSWAALFPFATQSARIVAPMALLLLVPWRVERPKKPRITLRVRLAMSLLLAGAGITFFAHGIESLQRNPVFLDLLISTGNRLFGVSLSQASAEALLFVVGIIDLIVAVACLSNRMRGVLWWMAFWGAITTLSRITAIDWQVSWFAAATRAPHIGVPLAAVLHWHWLRQRDDETSTKAAKTMPEE